MISRKFLLPLMVIGIALTGMIVGSTQSEAKKKKQKATHYSGPPSLSLAATPTMLRSCETTRVELVATARSADGSPLRYKWTTNAGHLSGQGANTTWDLSGARPGVYQAVVEVDNGRDLDCVAFSTATIVLADCPPPPVQPVCPTVQVACPDAISENQPITFNVAIAGEVNHITGYNWTISAGRIISGQGTPSITVDISGLAGQTVRADVDIAGFDMPCPASCSVSVPVPLKPRKFDEYPDIAFNDEKARLDNFAIQLQQEPGAKGYVIVHPSDRARGGVAERRARRINDYLVNTRGIDASRVVTTINGSGPEWVFELWIVPEGAPPPNN